MKSHLERHAQILAAIAIRLPGRRVEHGRAARLAYLADREMMRRHGYPIYEGRRLSTGSGALCIDVLRTVRDGFQPRTEAGVPLFSSSDGYACVVSDEIVGDDLDLFSVAEVNVLESMMERWGALDAGGLDEIMSDRVAYPELEGLGIGHGVAVEAMFAAVGHADPEDAADGLASHRRLDEVFEIVASSVAI